MAHFAQQSHFEPAEIGPLLAGNPCNPNGRVQAALACFAIGTTLEADGGAVPVDHLEPGHRVWTKGDGLCTVLHRSRFRLDPDLLQAREDLKPYLIATDTFGPGMPASDLVLAARHRLRVRAPFQRRRDRGPDVRVTVRRLQDLPGISVLPPEQPVDYIALLLDGPHCLSVRGLLCEAFPVGLDALDELFGLPVSAQPNVNDG